MEPRVQFPQLQKYEGVMSSILARDGLVSFPQKGKKKYPSDAILHYDADIDAFSEQTGGPHTFNHAVLSPQYQRNADGSYANVGAKPAVDVFDGEKFLRSCGAVTNLLPSGAEDLTTWSVARATVHATGVLTPQGDAAYSVAANSELANHKVYKQVAVPVGSYTVRLLLKKDTTRYVAVSIANQVESTRIAVLIDFDLKTISLVSGSGRYSIEEQEDGWFLLNLSGDAISGDISAAVFVYVRANSGESTFTGTTEAALVGSPQLTATAYPVPYVPPGVTQPASNATTTNGVWFTLPKYIDKVAGAGVGPCPESVLPPLMVPMDGHDDPTSPNYGTYIYDGVADMCFIPRFYYKVNNALGYTFGTHGANTITIRGSETFASTAAANIAGFALHRAFIDGGIEHAGFFVDKYKCSKVAKGTGFVAGSVKNGLPISTAAAHNPIAELTSVSADNYAACIDAAKGRDGNNGVKNTSSIFAPISVFQRSALALFSLGYGEAATESDYCAWYDATGLTNFPKGCNNNNLGDVNDGSVKYTSDGYLTCGKTGSGTPFAKTTHNGQECGVTDLNGLMWEANIGMTCIATTKSITGATQANPCVLTVPGHGLTTGRIIQVVSVVGMTQLNDKLYTVTVLTPDTISLDGVNSTGFTAYDSGGSIAYGNFYAAKEAASMRDFTSGASLATDHWGATGVAAMMDEIALPLAALPGGSPMLQRFGNAANQVLSSDTSGAGHVLTGIGHPMTVNGMSTTGTDLFGKDQISQYFRDQLCVISGGAWYHGSYAGVFARYLYSARYDSNISFGLRCACYPDTINDPSATPPSILGSKVRSVSPLWKALAGDEVKGSPLTLATRMMMGVGSADYPRDSWAAILSQYASSTDVVMTTSFGLRVGEDRIVRAADRAGSGILINNPWPRNSIIRRVTQVNTAGTQYRVGYMIEGTDTAIQWSAWVNFDGSFNPSTLYRLMLGYANAYPMWYNKITAWKEEVSDARILEALS